MFKHIILIILISLAAIFWLREIAQLLPFLSFAHGFVASELAKLFPHGGMIVDLTCKTIALFLIPLVIALIPSLIYYIVTRKKWRYFPEVMWSIWLLLVSTLALHA